MNSPILEKTDSLYRPARAAAWAGLPKQNAVADTTSVERTRDDRHRLISLRGILVGLAGVLTVSILTPFNDYIANDSSNPGSSLMGSALPIALVLFFLFVILAINVPLRRWFPRAALGQGELALAMAMTMVSCAIPGSALLKYVPAHLVGLWDQAANNGSYISLLDRMHLPSWLFPTVSGGTDVVSRAGDPVTRGYIGRIATANNTIAEHFAAVPWHAWLMPALAWGALFACLFGAGIFMAVLTRRQWVENERLAFPIANLCGALIEDPKPGRAINETFRHPAFLIAFIAVFAAHGINALHQYFPITAPAVPLEYDISGLFVNAPFTYIDPAVAKARISFMVIGVMYFVSTKIGFSVWFCMLGLQVYRMFMPASFGGQFTGDTWPGAGMGDHLIGAMVPYTLSILWLGRAEWATIFRLMIGRARAGDEVGAFVPYSIAGWGFVASAAGMFAWLMAAGTGPIGSTLLTVFMLTLMLLLMRIVAETGIFAIQFLLPMERPWQYLFRLMPAMAARESTLKPYFLTAFFDVHFTVTQRESLPVFASQSLRIAELEAPAAARRRWTGLAFVGAMILSLAVGYVVSGGSLLFYEYKYAATLDSRHESPVNSYGVGESATYALVDAAGLDSRRAAKPIDYSATTHILSGAAVTSVLAILSLRFAWWPIHPLGYLLLFSWTTWVIWPSVFLGWAAKKLMLGFGGSTVYRSARPLFIGMIVAESAAMGFWLLVGLVCVMCGWQSHAVYILPF